MNKEIAIKVLEAHIEFAHNSSYNGYVKWDLDEMLLDIDESIVKDFWYSDEDEEFLEIDKVINTALSTLGVELIIK